MKRSIGYKIKKFFSASLIGAASFVFLASLIGAAFFVFCASLLYLVVYYPGITLGLAVAGIMLGLGYAILFLIGEY